MAQATHLASLDVDVVHREELHVGDRSAIDLVEDLFGVRSLDLESIVTTRDRLAARMGRGAVVTNEVDLVAAGLAVELQPVHRGCAAHEQQFVLVEMEQDAVTDDKTV